MAIGLTPHLAERKRKAFEKKHGKPYVILRASNGEMAILSREYVDACYPKKDKSNAS